jgi:hypothetical protein
MLKTLFENSTFAVEQDDRKVTYMFDQEYSFDLESLLQLVSFLSRYPDTATLVASAVCEIA